MKLIPVTIIAICSALTSGSVHAASLRGSQFQTDENGFAKAPAEFSSFTIRATTHCATTASEANQKLKAITSQVEEVLKRFADPTIEEGIQVFPGATAQGELTKYEAGTTVKICTGWNATKQYFFKLGNLNDIPEFQDTVLDLNPQGERRVEIALSAPKPGIFSKTYESLVDKALKDAHQKAVRRAKVLLEDMPQFTNVRLNKVTSTINSAGSVAYDQTGLGGDPSLSALSSVTVNITRSFQFELVP